MKKKRVFSFLLTLILAFNIGFSFQGSTNVDAASKKYVIKINKQMNCVTIYEKKSSGKLKPVRAMVCSAGNATPIGTFPLGEKMRWHTLNGPCYGQYCTRITRGFLFHSVWYYRRTPSSLAVKEYNKLGTTASHGCVRLMVADAKWIYDNVPSGSSVIIYNSSNPGPLGKPKAVKISGSTGWDPSDVWSSGNPWNSKKPSIKGAKSKTVAYGSKYKVKKGIKAVNTVGKDSTYLLSTSIKFNGMSVKRVNTSNPGVYKVTYSITDEAGKAVSKTVKIKVKAKRATPKISNVKNIYIKSKSQMTKKTVLKNVVITQKGIKLDAKYVKVTFKKLKKNVYRVTYIAKRESYEAKKTAKVYIDTKAPVISGIKNGAQYEAESDAVINDEYCRGFISGVSDNYTKIKVSDINIKINSTEIEGRYEVVYTVKDEAGNQAKYTIRRSYFIDGDNVNSLFQFQC